MSRPSQIPYDRPSQIPSQPQSIDWGCAVTVHRNIHRIHHHCRASGVGVVQWGVQEEGPEADDLTLFTTTPTTPTPTS